MNPFVRMLRPQLLVLTALLVVSSVTRAQTPATPVPEDESLRERSVYVPYEKLWKVFEKEGRGVFMPYDTFMSLWQEAEQKRPKPAKAEAPFDALITEVRGTVSVGKDVVTVKADITIDVLKKGWHEVDIGLGDTALTKATINGVSARLLRRPNGHYALLVQGADDAEQTIPLQLEFAKSYTKAPGRNSVSFQCPPSPVSRWDVHVPEAGVDVDIQPMLATTTVPATEDSPPGTHVLAFVGAAPSLRIDWTAKATGAMGLQALAHVQADHQIWIQEGLMRTKVALNYTISRAEASQLIVDIPAGQKVVNVFDQNVREWSVEKRDDVQRVTAHLFQPVQGKQALIVELEKISSKSDKAIPVVRAADVSRQSGVVVVKLGPNLRAEPTERESLLQVGARDLPNALKNGGWDFSYRYAALPFALGFHIDTVQPEIYVDTFVNAHLAPEALDLHVQTVLDVQKSGVFDVLLRIPADHELKWVQGYARGDVKAAEIDSFDEDEASSTNRMLRISLSRQAKGKTGIAYTLHRELEHPELLDPLDQDAELALPLPRAVGAHVKREQGHIVVHGAHSLRINPAERRGMRPVSIADAFANRGQTPQYANARPVLAFAFTANDAALSIAAHRRPPHIVADQLLTVRIEAGVAKYEALFVYNIQYSGVKAVDVRVPPLPEANIHMKASGLRRTILRSPDVDDLPEGYEIWRIEGETELEGHTRFSLVWEDRLAKLDVGKSATLAIPRLSPQGVDRAQGQILLSKAEAIDISPREDTTGLRPIDPRQDLTPNVRYLHAKSVAGNVARAFEFHDAWTLSVQATRYEPKEIKTTSIERGLVRMVVTRSGQTSIQAVYRMRSARQRLEVQLDGDVAFDTQPVRLNGRVVPLEQGGPGRYFVPLLDQAQDVPFLLELRYTQIDTGLSLPTPIFPEEPAIQQVYLSVHVPSDLSFLGSRGPWNQEIVWTLRDFETAPRGNRPDSSLLSWASEGVAGGAALQNFATDGMHLLFSSLKPVGGAKGAVHIAAIKTWQLKTLALTAIIAIGLLLLPAGWGRRFIAMGAAVILLIMLAIYVPGLARSLVNNATVGAGLVIAVLWVLWFLLVTVPRSQPWIDRRNRIAEARIKRRTPPPPPTTPETAETPPDTEAPKGGDKNA